LVPPRGQMEITGLKQQVGVRELITGKRGRKAEKGHRLGRATEKKGIKAGEPSGAFQPTGTFEFEGEQLVGFGGKFPSATG